jgi:kynurenine formamidase
MKWPEKIASNQHISMNILTEKEGRKWIKMNKKRGLKLDTIIDLSMPIEEDMRVFPGMPGPTCTRVKTHEKKGVQVTRLEMLVHQGTHVDAPLHMFRNGETIDQVPLDRLIGEAVVFNLKHKLPGEMISASDFEKYAEDTSENDIVILNTGYEFFLDSSQYCIIAPEAAQWLVKHQIKCLAMDLPSLDPVSKKNVRASKQTHPSHHIILDAKIPIVECLVNLDALTRSRVFFCCLCLRILNSDGAPARAIALELD